MTYRHIIIAITTILTLKLQITAKINAVTVFRREEIELHKYSAVLAAIEPYRLELEEEIKNSINPIAYAFHKLKGESNCVHACVNTSVYLCASVCIPVCLYPGICICFVCIQEIIALVSESLCLCVRSMCLCMSVSICLYLCLYVPEREKPRRERRLNFIVCVFMNVCLYDNSCWQVKG